MRVLATLLLLVTPTFADFRPSLIGGRPVGENEYPEVIRISSGRSYCTASVVAPRVILTAGHCTTEDGEIRPVSETEVYEFVFKQMGYKARCKLAPSYRDGRRGVGSHDMALCKTDRSVDVKYASVARDEPKRGETQTLIGFGCVRGESPHGGNDGILRVGEAPVEREATKDNFHYYTRGDVTLCYGDSGGPAFKHVRDPKREHHYVQGVNSMGNIVDLALLTSVAHKNSVEFMKDFEDEQDVEICGVSRKCDDDGEEPKHCAEEFADVERAVKNLGQCLSN